MKFLTNVQKCKKIVAKFLKITFRNVKITSKRGKKIEKNP